MEITIKNYKVKLSPELIKKSLRCGVRECDQVNPGDFESYVDELDNSYDVRLTIKKDEVAAHSCDCQSKVSFCQHKVALLNFIIGGIKRVIKDTKAKKTDPVRKALEEADPEKIKEWVFKTLKKYKDLNLAFMNEFSNQSESHTPSEIIVLTQNAVGAVINKRRKAEATEVKKIVDLWADFHRPILDQYFAEPTNGDYFAQVHALIDTVVHYKYRILTSSKRMDTYLAQILQQLTEVILIIQDEESWQKSLAYFSKEFFLDGYGGIRREYTNLFVNIFNSTSADRRSKIAGILAGVYISRKDERVSDSKELLELLLRMVVVNEQFSEYKTIFKPIRHALDYNLRLIDSLIKINELQIAESYCIEQINQNIDEYYNWDYISRLKQIYIQTKDHQKIISILSKELLRRPDFEDYKLVSANIPQDAEFKKWRNRVLANARQIARLDKKAADFVLALCHWEGNLKGLLSYIDEHADYDSVAIYATDLINYSPELFMGKIIHKMDSYRDVALVRDHPSRLDETLEKLYQAALSKYGTEILLLMVREEVRKYKSWVNFFVKYVIKKLAPG